MKLVFQTLRIALLLVSCPKAITTEREVTAAVAANETYSLLKPYKLTIIPGYSVKYLPQPCLLLKLALLAYLPNPSIPLKFRPVPPFLSLSKTSNDDRTPIIIPALSMT